MNFINGEFCEAIFWKTINLLKLLSHKIPIYPQAENEFQYYLKLSVLEGTLEHRQILIVFTQKEFGQRQRPLPSHIFFRVR